MGRRTSYDPGTFCWVDLATTDPEAAKRFYTQLFGWDAEDTSAGEGATYTMLRLDGDDLCALYEQRAEQREQGMPPSWTSYVTVENADATAGRVRELGGELLAEAFDVMDAGRMAVVQDPTGAVCAVWQPRSNIGADRVNEPGCLCWNELATNDVEGATPFYGSLLDWGFEPIDTGEGGPEVSTITNAAGWRNGSTRKLTGEQAGLPPHWLPYFCVSSCSESVDRAKELGAGVLLEPMEIPSGRIAALRDPQGAAFAIADGYMDD
jgi:predicted enzyme related to lactoylglutathione lyase